MEPNERAIKHSPSDFSCGSYDLFLGQDRSEAECKDRTSACASNKSHDRDNDGADKQVNSSVGCNTNMRKVILFELSTVIT